MTAHHRIHTLLLVLILITGVAILGVLASNAFGGPLDPPGPPGPTMKTLQEVEPRTPISSVPYTISQPGSYYLTRNLTAPEDTVGIVIDADDVTLDLNGFTLWGDAVGHDGITVPNPSFFVINTTIRNGSVRGFRNGISVEASKSGTYEDLVLINNVGSGIRAGPGSLVQRVHAHSNGEHGILVNEGIPNRTTGSIVRDCVASYNRLDGIQFNNFTHFEASGGALIEDNVAGGNGNADDGAPGTPPYGAGIRVNGVHARVEGNNVTHNDGFGILVTGTNNYVVANSGSANLDASAAANVDNFSVAAGNFAPEETSPSVTNPLSNVNY
jgi:hypothetical protein